MTKVLKYLFVAAVILPAVPSFAGTLRMPQCLVYSNLQNGSVPCTGTVPVDSTSGDPLRWQDIFPSPSAASTAITVTGSATSSVTRVGPYTPQLNRALRVTVQGTWTGSVAIGTSVDNCVTVAPLTVAGSPWAVFTANANEDVDVPHVDGVTYCATTSIQSGTATVSFRQ